MEKKNQRQPLESRLKRNNSTFLSISMTRFISTVSKPIKVVVMVVVIAFVVVVKKIRSKKLLIQKL